jgi:hypothetical protein
MKPKIPLIDGDEVDAFSKKARKFLNFRPGVRKKSKKSFWKRFRKKMKEDINNDI